MKMMTGNMEGIAMDYVAKEDLHPAEDNHGNMRLVDGRPVYSLRGVVVRDAEGRTIKASTVRVKNKPVDDIPDMSKVRCVDCVSSVWQDGNRIAISVTADHVEIVTNVPLK
ncbi:hypothetical protein BAAM0499_07860 [Bifidobacterium animalis subsp. animalis MCC 0499]|uniref:hypothetical protein n=1 Tax=Bifidobacterium animalis TaxID=28025 RepID=UPI000699281D|nr:hypothetical protein [Bifidobacterium animalis]KOA59061.1 hypothetical protein BAAM0499_07860 [Bifidobacterium animalis subsp. animalis MCC 0499]